MDNTIKQFSLVELEGQVNELWNKITRLMAGQRSNKMMAEVEDCRRQVWELKRRRDILVGNVPESDGFAPIKDRTTRNQLIDNRCMALNTPPKHNRG